jgi:hypothetical protein
MAKPSTVFADRAFSAPKPPDWQSTHGTYLSGQAEIDDLDVLAAAMERKWGCDRLRLLVPVELREKFDRQRYLTNQAIWHGDLEAVRTQARRMQAAWRALDKVATEAGSTTLPPEVWEVTLSDGSVAALVREDWQASLVSGDGRFVRVFTLAEVGRLLAGSPAASFAAAAKVVFPGATVVHVRSNIGDPLNRVHDTSGGFDDPLPW